MDLKSGYPFWAVKNGLMKAFPPLEADISCDVAVIGGGITGALIADELATHGHDVVVIEQRDVGWGSTSASTALLQYEIDTHLVDLARKYGEPDSLCAYRACVGAIGDLRALAEGLRDVDFRPQRSLYYASRDRDMRALREEFDLRARRGFAVHWIDADELRADYGLKAPGAILSDVAASVDPYRMAHRLLERLSRQGLRVFDRTTIAAIDASTRAALLRTDKGMQVRCAHVVLAAGYANQRWLDENVARNRSSYALMSDPLGGAELGFISDTLVWETARPYLYLRSTGDGRLLVGGEDDDIDIPARRDQRVEKKARRLLERVKELYPGMDVAPAFSWAGTFAETSDGLPFFGPHAQYGPRVHFAMAYGGNGITYSMIGAGLVRARIERRSHPLARFFSFGRLGFSA